MKILQEPLILRCTLKVNRCPTLPEPGSTKLLINYIFKSN